MRKLESFDPAQTSLDMVIQVCKRHYNARKGGQMSSKVNYTNVYRYIVKSEEHLAGA